MLNKEMKSRMKKSSMKALAAVLAATSIMSAAVPTMANEAVQIESEQEISEIADVAEEQADEEEKKAEEEELADLEEELETEEQADLEEEQEVEEDQTELEEEAEEDQVDLEEEQDTEEDQADLEEEEQATEEDQEDLEEEQADLEEELEAEEEQTDLEEDLEVVEEQPEEEILLAAEEPKKEPVIVESIQMPEGMTDKGEISMGGTGEMHLCEDAEGNEWLFKPAQSKAGNPEPFRAYVQEAGYKVQSIVDPDTAVQVGTGDINGKFGAYQQKIATDSEAFDYWAWQKSETAPEIPDSAVSQLLREHVTDWLMGNFDSHGRNFLTDTNGTLVGVDKEQSFRYLSDPRSAKMSYNYHPNEQYGETEPIYNTLFRRYARGEVDLNLEETMAYVERIESIPDEDYREIFRKYAESLRGPGSDAEELLDAILARKQNLRETYNAFYADLVAERNGEKEPEPDVDPEIEEEFKRMQAEMLDSLYSIVTCEECESIVAKAIEFTKAAKGIEELRMASETFNIAMGEEHMSHKSGEEEEPVDEPEEEEKPEEEVKPGEETKPGEEVKPGEEAKPGEEVKPGEETKPGEAVKPQASENKADASSVQKAVQTGDSNNLFGYIGAMFAAMILGIGSVIYKKKRMN